VMSDIEVVAYNELSDELVYVLRDVGENLNYMVQVRKDNTWRCVWCGPDLNEDWQGGRMGTGVLPYLFRAFAKAQELWGL
jgi:hypothetical protein